MKRIVIYCSHTGMTRQVAQTIAKELECALDEITESTTIRPEDYDSYSDLIIGTPVRFASIHPVTSNFISSIDLRGRKVFPFITHGGIYATIKSQFDSACIGARTYNLLKVHTINGEFRTPEQEIIDWCNYVKSNSIL